jgi:hypothetical protein
MINFCPKKSLGVGGPYIVHYWVWVENSKNLKLVHLYSKI